MRSPRAVLRLAAILALASSATLLAVAPVAAVDPGDNRVHDPMMIAQGRTYYVFFTGGGLQVITSTNRLTWSFAGPVFDTIPSWVSDAVGPLTDLWAPDVSYFNGLYHLYYAGSQFGTNTSVIGLATNKTLDRASAAYHWVDRGLVVGSTASDDYNAIDPTLSVDAVGHPWLAFGSFWTGIKLRRLDATTGKPSRADTQLYSLAQRLTGPDAIEAPFITHRGRYYYLFVSYDFCCQGAQSTYRIMVGRAGRITGPYTDGYGGTMMHGDARQILASRGRFRGPGGQSIFVEGQTYWLVYHYYDANDGGTSKLGLRRLGWTADGWPYVAGPLVVAPQ